MEVVFIDSDDKRRGLYRIYLENILDDCQVHEFFSFKNAEEFLLKRSNQQRPFTFVMANNNSKEGDIDTFYQKFHAHFKMVPLVVFSEDPLDMIKGLKNFTSHHPQNSHIQIPLSPADFRERVLEVVYPDRMNLTPVPAFQKVRLFNFYRFNKPQCHVYIKLSRMKYVKIFNEGVKYGRHDLDRLKEKEVEYLYIRNEDFQCFQVNFFRNNFLEFDADEASPEELKEKLEFTHAMLHELVLNLGFSDDAIKLTEKSIEAIFHDITIKESKIAKVKHKDDPSLQAFSEDEVKEYLRHPLDAFDLILEYPNIPPKVAEVICQHHETPEGDGFPNSLRPVYIDPLSAVFILAHEFVGALEECAYDESQVEKNMNAMQLRFDVGPFKVALRALVGEEPQAA